MAKKAQKPTGKVVITANKLLPHTHRGRIQAQGKHLEDSESWAQYVPLLVDDGIDKSHILESRLEYRQQQIRKVAFESCRKFMIEASENGGFNGGGRPKTYLVQPPNERVDIEVHLGLAFVKKT